MCDEPAVGFEFQVCRARAGDVRIEIDAVCNLGHQRLEKAGGKPAIVIFDHGAIGITAGVGRVVVGAVVVHRPIQELEMAVAAPGIGVDKIDHAEFSGSKLNPADGERCGEIELVAVGFRTLTAQRNDLANHQAGDIGILAEIGVTHHVEVGRSGETESVADAVASGAFHIEKDLCSRGQLITEIERVNLRSGAFGFVAQAVWAAVRGWKRRMPLKNNVALAGDPPAARLRMREEGERIGRIGVRLRRNVGGGLRSRSGGRVRTLSLGNSRREEAHGEGTQKGQRELDAEGAHRLDQRGFPRRSFSRGTK